jgi:hypothetical protein
MSQSQRDQPTQPARVRAEALFDRMGQRIGSFTALATERIQRAATSIREEADRLDQLQTVSGAKSNGTAGARTQETGRPVREKAEEMVDRVGQRLRHSTALAGLQIQRAAARLREDAEDMWAQAQNLRRHNGRTPS